MRKFKWNGIEYAYVLANCRRSSYETSTSFDLSGFILSFSLSLKQTTADESKDKDNIEKKEEKEEEEEIKHIVNEKRLSTGSAMHSGSGANSFYKQTNDSSE